MKRETKKSCDKPCSTCDYYPGGYCDRNGCIDKKYKRKKFNSFFYLGLFNMSIYVGMVLFTIVDTFNRFTIFNLVFYPVLIGIWIYLLKKSGIYD